MIKLLDKVAAQKQNEEEEQTAIYEHGLLSGSERISTKPELLILRKTSNLNALTFEETLGSATRGTPPIIGKLLELKSRRNGIRGITQGLVVFVTTGPAFIDSSIQHGEFLFQATLIEIVRVRRRGRRGG